MRCIPLTIVPDVDDPECADVFLDVEIAGVTQPMVLDTGAAHTHLVSDERTEALPVVHRDSSAGALGVGSDDLVSVSDVRVGPVEVPDLDVVRIPPQQPGARHLLGMDVLRGSRWELRLSASELWWPAPGEETGVAATHELELDDRGHSYVTLEWPDGSSARACWDTGAGITVVDASFQARHPTLFRQAGTAFGIDSTGTRVETPIQLMQGPVIGGAGFAEHRVAVVDLSAANATLDVGMDVILGYPTLVQADWWLDFPGRRWNFTRTPEEVAETAYWERLYGRWDSLDLAAAADLLSGLDRPWWVVGGAALDAFTGSARPHDDVDISILASDVGALRAHLGPGWQLWTLSKGAMRPLTDQHPDAFGPDSQLWLRRHGDAPWVLDLPLTPDPGGLWSDKLRPGVTAPLDDVTWVDAAGIRYLRPEIVLLFKAHKRRTKDERDLRRTWPLLNTTAREWLIEALRREEGSHPWLSICVT